jgi:hypothetical protein
MKAEKPEDVWFCDWPDCRCAVSMRAIEKQLDWSDEGTTDLTQDDVKGLITVAFCFLNCMARHATGRTYRRKATDALRHRVYREDWVREIELKKRYGQ